MINLRLRSNRWSLWGEHCGVKVQRSTGKTDKAEAEKIRLEVVAQIERDNPVLAKAYHMKQNMLAARNTPTVKQGRLEIGDWRNVQNWKFKDAVHVFLHDQEYGPHRSIAKIRTLERFVRLLGEQRLPVKRKDAQNYMDILESNATRPWQTGGTYNKAASDVKSVLNYVANNCAENDAPIRYQCPKFVRRTEEIKDTFLTEEQVRDFLETARREMPDKAPIFVVMAYIGARPVELARLDWMDVYLGNRAEDSSLKLKSYKGSTVIKKLKPRSIPMHPLVYDELNAVPSEARYGKVFKTRYGKAYYHDGRPPAFCGTYVFGKIKKKSNVPPEMVAYDLRHTFASWLRMKGEHLDTIAKFLGHSKLETTQRYAHLHPDYLRASMNKLPSVA